MSLPTTLVGSDVAINYVINGQAFSATSSASLSNTSETPIVLFSNPSNSGIDARAKFFYNATDASQGTITTRFYTAPTVTSNGTDVSSIILNNYVGGVSNQDSKVKLYAAPTISANGNKRITMIVAANTSPMVHDFSQTAILTPGQSLLMTFQAGNMGLQASMTCYFFLEWFEV